MTSDVGLAVMFWSENLWNAEGMRASIAQAETEDRLTGSQKSKTATVS